MTSAEAARRGARALVIGVTNPGGVIQPAWLPALISALENGLDIIAGMHSRLADVAELADVCFCCSVAGGLPRS